MVHLPEELQKNGLDGAVVPQWVPVWHQPVQLRDTWHVQVAVLEFR